MAKGFRIFALIALVLAVPACGGGKKRRAPAPVPGTVQVTPTVGLTSTEAGSGGTASFDVVLGKAPTADVTIALGTSAPGEGAPNKASLTFTSVNWNVPQTVLVVGINDDVDDGDQAYTITLAPCVSADLTYVGIDPTDVSVTNTDDDTAGFVFDQTSGLVTTEGGGPATFSVTLATKPTADVTFDLSSDNLGEGTVSPLTLTFTAAAGADAWNTPHVVTVTGVNDVAPFPDGPVVYHIVTTDSVSTDANYNAKVVSDVTVTNNDNDSAGITATPTSGLLTGESGGTDSFTVVLNTQPATDVVISVTSSDATAGLVSDDAPPTLRTTLNLTFTNGNWDQPQTVTLTGVNDAFPTDNAAVPYTITLAVVAGSDATYLPVTNVVLSATNADDDVPGITVTPLAGLVTTEAGGGAGSTTFLVHLDTVPSGVVIVNLLSSDTAEATVSGGPLTFLADSSALGDQIVTLTGVPDSTIDGNKPYTVTLTVDPTTGDATYAAIAPIVVNATNNDIDLPSIVLSKTDVLTSEDGLTDSFTVALTSIPAATVTITLALTTAVGEATVTPSLTFQPNSSALVAQLVTVTGVDNDALVDGPVAYVITGTPSGDVNYGAALVFTVNGTNNDNDILIPTGAGPYTKTPGASFPLGAAGAWDAKSAQEPCVVKIGATYVMWYEGLNVSGQKHEQIGRAFSNDGILWIKDASPVLAHSGANTFDEKGVGDPSVIYDAANVTAPYQMWYSGRQNAATKNRIGRATSLDGITWTRSATPVLSASQTFDAVGVSGPAVIYDPANVAAPYQMWFTSLDAQNVNRIGRATSLDGITWTKTTGAVLSLGTAGTFDAASVKLCAVLLDGGTYRMWYVGLDVTGVAGRQKIGFAQSPDGIAWTKFVNPALTAGAAAAFDEKNLWSPWVILDGPSFKMWYGGENNAGAIQIGFAQIP